MHSSNFKKIPLANLQAPHKAAYPTSRTHLACIALLMLGTAQAQTDANTENLSPENQARQLPEVVVTSRQGQELQRDVPFTVTTISGEQLERRRLLKLEEVLRETPGVVVENMEGDVSANIRIRGVGALYQSGPDAGLVSFNLDGLSLPGRDMSLATFDIEQIEVLKGPQGTVFGRTSEAGTVNVVSRRPSREREGHVRLELGQQNQRLLDVAAGGPLNDVLSARVAMRGQRYDWWIDNMRTGKPEVSPSETAIRASLQADFAPGSSALLMAERQKNRHRPVAMVLLPYGEFPGNDIEPGLMDGNYRTFERYSLELNHQLPGSRLTAITGLLRTDMLSTSIYDNNWARATMGMDMEAAQTGGFNNERTLSQELRWQSLPGADVFWTSGVYLSSSKAQPYSLESVFYPAIQNDTKQQTRAIFGEVTYPLSPAWRITAGLRHTWDDKKVTYHAVSQKGRIKDDYTTGRLGLTYALNPTTNIYGVLARGYTSGGFKFFTSGMTAGVYDTDPTKPSSTVSAELGLKTELKEYGLSANVALFHGRTRDNHLWGTDPLTGGALIYNANTRSRGVELEGQWQASRHWNLGAGLTYTSAEITDGLTNVSGGDIAAGSAMKEVPRWSGNLRAEYTTPIKVLANVAGLNNPRLNVQANYTYVGTRPADPQNHYIMAAWGKLDMRVAIQGSSTEFYVWADNLLDKQYDLWAYQYSPGIVVGSPARGRSIGIGMNWYF